MRRAKIFNRGLNSCKDRDICHTVNTVKLGDEANSNRKPLVVGTVSHTFLFSNELLPSAGGREGM